jgi:putative hydrolase of the HAD superfamily
MLKTPAAGLRLRAVTFDVGGTLITPWPSVGHIYAEVAARHGGEHPDPERLNQQFAAAWRARKPFRHSRTEWAALVDATFAGCSRTPPSETFFPELYARFAEPGAWRLFDDAVPTLEALATRGLRLGVISNWDERLRPLLRGLGLSDYFEAIIVSCEVGEPKPSRLMFERAAADLAVAPEAILHVGDSREMDLAGARGAGLQARLLRRDQPTKASSLQIQSLRELV